jgi:hypothetical protein
MFAGTVQSDIGLLVQAFWSNRQEDPTSDPNGQLSAHIYWQYAGFASSNPPAKREKAISLRVLKFMCSTASSDLLRHGADLAIGVFFFACQSCKYLQVKRSRCTLTLQKGDIIFRRNRTVVPHDSPNLHRAKTVTLLFQDQKNRAKGVHRTTWVASDPKANPVVIFANIVHCIASLPGTTNKTFIYNYKALPIRSFLAVSDASILLALRVVVTVIGMEALGYSAADVGTHSIRSGNPMALALLGHTAWHIMLAG